MISNPCVSKLSVRYVTQFNVFRVRQQGEGCDKAFVGVIHEHLEVLGLVSSSPYFQLPTLKNVSEGLPKTFSVDV